MLVTWLPRSGPAAGQAVKYVDVRVLPSEVANARAALEAELDVRALLIDDEFVSEWTRGERGNP